MATEKVGIFIEVEGYEKAKKILETLQGSIDVLNNATSIKLDLDTSRASRNLDNLHKKSLSLNKVYNTITKSVLHMGSAMQSAGNALTKMSNPFRSFMRSTFLAAGFKAFDAMSTGFSNGFNRYDTLKQYSMAMEEFATASYSVKDSQDALVASVKGMPTGLDEIASLAQRYTLSLGDMEEGTQLAIATNNAFLASMATDSQRYQGMMQLQDLVNGKDLTSKEWMSLGSSMGKAINEIGKELGYGSDQMGEFRAELYAGNISTEKFMAALKKVGTGEGSIAKLAGNVKVTWGAVFSNIGNAFARMTQGILESLDEISQETWGKSLPLVMAEQLDKIDNVTAKMKDYIVDHKDVILGFVDLFKQIDWASIGKSFVEGIEFVVQGLSAVAEFFGGKGTNILKNYAKFVPIASVLGKFLTIFGGLWKGSRHIVGGTGTGLFALLRGIAKLTGLDGIADKIKGLGRVADASKGVAKKLPNISDLMLGFKRNLIGLGNFGISALKIGTIVGGSVLAVRAIKDIVRNLADISYEVQTVDWDTLGTFATQVVTFVGAVAVLGGAWGKTAPNALPIGFTAIEKGVLAIGAIITTILGFAWLDSLIIEGTLNNFVSACESLNKIADELNKLEGRKVNASKIAGLFKGFKKVFDEIMPSGGKENIGSISSNDAKDIATVFQSLSESMGYATDALNAIDKIQGANFDVLRTGQKIQSIVAIIATLYNAVEKYFGEEQMLHNDVGGTTVTKQGITADSVKNVENAVGIFNHLASVIDTIKPLVGKIKELSDLDPKMVEENMKNVNKVMKAIFTQWGELTGGEWFKKIKNAPTDAANMQGVVDTIANFKAVLGAIRDLMADGVFTGDPQQGALVNRFNIENIQPIMDKIGDFATSANGIPNPSIGINRIGQVQELLDAMTSMFEAINGFNVDEGLTGVVEEIKTHVEEIKTALNELYAVIQEIGTVNGQGNGQVNMEIRVNGRVTGADDLVRDIKSNTSKIRNAVNSVPSSFTKKISVHFSAILSGAGTIASQIRSYAERIRNSVLGGNGFSSGGLVKPMYLAKGGSPWRPRGTDTVPAMLTPGEFVQRRAAVNTFGLDFMRKVNSLDVYGAMQSISARLGKSMNTGTVINNYNNNAQVIQHITHPTQDFTYRRASRYVGAL